MLISSFSRLDGAELITRQMRAGTFEDSVAAAAFGTNCSFRTASSTRFLVSGETFG